MDLPLGLSAFVGQSLLKLKQALKYPILDTVPDTPSRRNTLEEYLISEPRRRISDSDIEVRGIKGACSTSTTFRRQTISPHFHIHLNSTSPTRNTNFKHSLLKANLRQFT
jgi:hypothetical protein